jgi:hypothetical protein
VPLARRSYRKQFHRISSKSPVIPHIPHSLPQTNSDISPPCFLLPTHREVQFCTKLHKFTQAAFRVFTVLSAF